MAYLHWDYSFDVIASLDVTTEREGQALTVAKERKANAEKILEGWKQFVDELKKEGKYTEK